MAVDKKCLSLTGMPCAWVRDGTCCCRTPPCVAVSPLALSPLSATRPAACGLSTLPALSQTAASTASPPLSSTVRLQHSPQHMQVVRQRQTTIERVTSVITDWGQGALGSPIPTPTCAQLSRKRAPARRSPSQPIRSCVDSLPAGLVSPVRWVRVVLSMEVVSANRKRVFLP